MKTRKAIAASGAALVLAGGFAATANATTWTVSPYSSKFNANQTVQGPMIANLSFSRGVSPSGSYVHVAVHNPYGIRYASWAEGPGSACHSYAAAAWGPMIWNSETFAQTINGTYGTNGNSC